MKYNSKYQEKIDQLFHIVRKDIKINGKNITKIQEYQQIKGLLIFASCFMLFFIVKSVLFIYHMFNIMGIKHWTDFLFLGITIVFYIPFMVWMLYKIISITYYTALELILFSQMQKYFSIRQDLDNTLQKIHLLIREDKASWEIYPKIVNYIQVCSQIIEKNYRKLIFINTNIQRKLQILQKVEKISKMNAYNEYIQHELWEFTQCSEDIIFNLQDWLANHAKELKTLEDTLNENATILNLTKTRIQLQRTNIEKSLLIGNQ
jgi:hypothetical protein